MEQFLPKDTAGAVECLYSQKISNAEDRIPKMWSTQRSTVARLGLLRQSGAASQASTSGCESSDTLRSSSSSNTSLFSSPNPPSTVFPLPQKREHQTRQKSEKSTTDDAVDTLPEFQLDRQEALDALKSICKQFPNVKPNKNSIFPRDAYARNADLKLQSEEQNLSDKTIKSCEESLSTLAESENWVTCADFTNSMILKLKSPKEREEFADLCAQAMTVKLDTYNELTKKNSDMYQQKLDIVNNLNRENYKSHLCKVMLKLINNEKFRQEQEYKNSKLLNETHLRGKHSKKGIKQIYVVGGRPIVGETLCHENFPNTFASVSELADPKYGPPGYQRYKVEVDIKGLPGDQFTIQLYNERTLVFTTKDESSDATRVSPDLKLPKGIFADKLRIARKGNGPLILQEPWIF